MASVEKDGQGYRIRFIDHHRQRRAIRLGGMNKSNAEKIARHIEELVSWKKSGLTLDSATAGWIGKAGDELHKKLANAGLVEPRVSTTLGKFLEEYIDSKREVVPGTIKNLELCRWNLIACFGANTALRSMRPEHGMQFREWLLAEEALAENTVRRRCGRARQFFTEARRRGVAEINPFDGIPVTVRGNKAKSYFLTPEDSAKVLEACIDQEWRVIFALCRWGGLRCPSEIMPLRWEHVLWDIRRLIVKSPKTERFKGKESRVIPLFPEIEKELSSLFFAADPGEFVINRYRWKNQNLRTQFVRIIESAGLKPWVKPFQNLRATRDTELSEILPAHVVSSWIGHTEKVAREHYLHPNDAHFEKMTGGGAQGGAQHPRMPKSEGV